MEKESTRPAPFYEYEYLLRVIIIGMKPTAHQGVLCFNLKKYCNQKNFKSSIRLRIDDLLSENQGKPSKKYFE